MSKCLRAQLAPASGSAPKTNAERQSALRESRHKQGLKEVRNLWCHPEDEAAVREHVTRLRQAKEHEEARNRAGRPG
jgi:hypothetical protein